MHWGIKDTFKTSNVGRGTGAGGKTVIKREKEGERER